MGLDPAKTIYDLVMTSGDLDPDKLSGSVNAHPSGVHVIPAPVRPEDAELVQEDRVAHLLEVAKQAYDVIVVDTPPQFQATTLATLDRTDRLALMGSLDIPTVKNIKLTLQTLGMLHYPTDRISFVLNRPQPRVEHGVQQRLAAGNRMFVAFGFAAGVRIGADPLGGFPWRRPLRFRVARRAVRKDRRHGPRARDPPVRGGHRRNHHSD